MSSATSFSKLGYFMLRKESAAGTPLYPNVALELLSEDLVVNWDHTPAGTIAGNRSMNLRPIKHRVGEIKGTIELLLEPKQFGHFLTAFFGEATDSTISAGVSFQHDFQPQTTIKTYTIDIKTAGESYVTRYFGVRAESLTWSIDENKIKVAFGIFAQKAFTNARITLAASSGTALKLDQTSGLTTSDTLIVLDADNLDTTIEELTVNTVTDETTLVTSTISQSLAVDDVVVIKAQTPTYDLGNEMIWSGGAQVAIGNGANGLQNLSAYVNVEEMEITFTNELEARWTATGNDVIDRFPATILLKDVSVEGSFTQFHQNPAFLDMLRQNEQVALRFEFLGSRLSANSAVAASATVETDGSDTLTVTVDTAGEAGNDYAIKIVQGSTTLSAALSGKLITVTLDADGADNTTSLVAAAINGLSGVACSSTGTDLVTTTDNPNKIYFGGGRDANEVEKLRIDLPDVRLKPFGANMSAEDIVNEEIEFTAYRDVNDRREVLVRLRNSVADY